ncbi:lactate dehydrogenase [Leuconostoc litchii]|uniref:D-2-hydroxyacid dehydrogenase n=1 Tax=Leuconostoc litchii TaxID=1981069 RepID=A0A6P2CM67_9LACO|nr:D-2-hydroxyacid dehydrogenase [Leuconostoc litchii]TYC46396.1 D-2-hydroxyacid dehydrogenase [Leuconostoc litchii]GMA70131.1 lactate dehydrogenase [Leuconostoc litchii]
MTKILMMSVRDDEEKAIHEYAQKNQVEIVISRQDFHPETLPDLTNIDGLVIQQTAKIGGNQQFYNQLTKDIQQIATRTAGYDMIEVELAKKAGLKITNVPAYSPRSVAEMALMQILRLLRHTPEFDTRIANNDFRWSGLQAREIHSVTVGIIGVGRIGGTLARLLNSLGAKVLGYDVNYNKSLSDVITYVSKDELLARSDVITLHVDLNETSINLISKIDFDKMKPGMLLINASRGPVVNTDDLIRAIEHKQLAGVALDTVENESGIFNRNLRESVVSDRRIHKLLSMSNVMVTPHVGFFTNIAVKNMVDISLDDTLMVLNNQKSPHEI